MSDFIGRYDSSKKCRHGCIRMLLAAALVLATGQPAWSQSVPIIYPSNGQSLEQQGQDEAACRTWAQQQTGFNPSQGPSYSTAPSPSGGGMVAGAARGAALGAVGGAIAGDAGKGAAVGAGVGATAGLMRRGRRQQAQQQAQQQAVDQYNQQRGNYYRAFGACMQGRGYVVN